MFTGINTAPKRTSDRARDTTNPLVKVRSLRKRYTRKQTRRFSNAIKTPRMLKGMASLSGFVDVAVWLAIFPSIINSLVYDGHSVLQCDRKFQLACERSVLVGFPWSNSITCSFSPTVLNTSFRHVTHLVVHETTKDFFTISWPVTCDLPLARCFALNFPRRLHDSVKRARSNGLVSITWNPPFTPPLFASQPIGIVLSKTKACMSAIMQQRLYICIYSAWIGLVGFIYQ